MADHSRYTLRIEATPPHVTYLLLSTFLISYVLFTNFLRNRRQWQEKTHHPQHATDTLV
jgi:hypothetical protein